MTSARGNERTNTCSSRGIAKTSPISSIRRPSFLHLTALNIQERRNRQNGVRGSSASVEAEIAASHLSHSAFRCIE
eukprot:6191353-Pleurochrysis_carterae.AAC.1